MAPNVYDYPALATLTKFFTIATSARNDDDWCDAYCLGRWKIIFSAILFVEGLIFGHLVLVLRNRSKKSQHTFATLTSFGHAFSTGVFLATGLLHIYPESIELFAGRHSHGEEDHGEEDHGDHDGHDHRRYLDIGTRILALRQTDDDNHDHDHEHDHENDDNEETSKPDGDDGQDHDDPGHDHGDEENNSSNTTGSGSQQGLGGGADGHDDHEIVYPWASFVVLCGFYALFFFERIIIPRVFGISHTHTIPSENEAAPIAGHDHHADASEKGASAEEAEVLPAREQSFFSRTFVVAVLQVIGISAHSLFESMLLGLGTNFTIVLNLFIAVVSHRWATSIAIAFTSAAKLAYWPFLVTFLLFSSMVPLGVGIGAAITSLHHTVQGALFALSAATFIYVGAYEGMVETFDHDHKYHVAKFLVVIAGAAVIAIITGILVANDIHG